jgi:hypothetical protein
MAWNTRAAGPRDPRKAWKVENPQNVRRRAEEAQAQSDQPPDLILGTGGDGATTSLPIIIAGRVEQ